MVEPVPDRHLGLSELNRLASDRMFEGTETRLSEAERQGMEEHFLTCTECFELLEQEQFLPILPFQIDILLERLSRGTCESAG